MLSGFLPAAAFLLGFDERCPEEAAASLAAAKTFLAEAVAAVDAKAECRVQCESSPQEKTAESTSHPGDHAPISIAHGSLLGSLLEPLRALEAAKAGALLPSPTRQGAYDEALATADEAIAACRP